MNTDWPYLELITNTDHYLCSDVKISYHSTQVLYIIFYNVR